MKRLFFAVLIVALASLWVSAQEKKADKKGEMKHDHAAMEKKGGMPMAAKPAPEMTKLIKMFSGTWTSTEKFEPGPMMPKGGTSKGTATFKAGPGGNSLIEEYSSPHGAMGAFHGHGVTWWDAKAGAYKGTWCDSMAPDCMVGGMKWDGDNIVAIPQEMDMGGQKMVMTSKYSDIKPDSITFTMGMGPTAAQAKTTMTIVYTKQGGMAAAPAAKKADEKPAATTQK
ncbi:MAG: DUF1579 domain-containing protein [Acidobacteriia bacterium]|jgi:hypothetical protein|nr:DUF1579 domain-containing protein [Terriglobia bacterium]